MNLKGIANILDRINYITRRFGIGRAYNNIKRNKVSNTWRDLSEEIEKIRSNEQKATDSSFFVDKRDFVGRNQIDINSIIKTASKRYGISEKLIRSVIKAESNFNPLAVSKKGAMGYMQLMPEVVKILGLKNPFDPYENILAGSYILRRLLDKYGGSLELALSAYNAGEKVVDKYKSIPPIRETQEYVRKVLSYLNQE
jgi:soluble lytic murein transglycosylase-like protein